LFSNETLSIQGNTQFFFYNPIQDLVSFTKKRTYKLDACLSVHRCICVEKKNQLHSTEWFIALIIFSTRFGHFYAHHQELETISVLLPLLLCDALVAGCRRSGVGSRQCVRDEGCCSSNIPHPERISFRTPDDGHKSARNMLC